VARWGWDILVAVGPLAVHMAEEAATAGLPRDNILNFPDSGAASGRINDIVRDGDLVLVKGSRGMRMEIIAGKLKTRGKD
jgi:UDP-N-acetylmuramoyl-tripeptide--D-alanyl-D-alanine ligase